RREPDRARLREIYTRMEFRGMLRALDAEEAALRGGANDAGGNDGKGANATTAAAQGATAAGATPATTSAADATPPADTTAATLAALPRAYETLVTEESLHRWLDLLAAAELTALDIETTSLNYSQARIVGLSFCIEPGKAAYLPLAHRYPGAPGPA